MAERLYRSRTDRILGGVAGGIAAATDVDPALVRIGWVVLGLVTQGAALVVYIACVVLIPEQPVGADDGAPERVATPAPDGGPSSTSSSRASTEYPSQLPLVLGLALIAIGAWYLVRQYLPAIDLGASWPVLAVGLGAVLLLVSLRRR